MKRGKGLALAMALVGMAGMGSVASAQAPITPGVETLATAKAEQPQRNHSRYKITNEVGGIPLHTHFPNYGMSPKEYGMKFGNGGSKKGNRLRFSHNSKLKRRKSK